jgi:hypothetical protein
VRGAAGQPQARQAAARLGIRRSVTAHCTVSCREWFFPLTSSPIDLLTYGFVL